MHLQRQKLADGRLSLRSARCDVSSLSLTDIRTAAWSSYLHGRHIVMYRVSRRQRHKLLDDMTLGVCHLPLHTQGRLPHLIS